MTAYFWQWWQGFVTVRLRGPGLERLLSKIAQAGIVLWVVERRTPEVMLARVGVKDFRRLRPLLWGSRINICILDRHGLPFLLRQIRGRLMLIAGLIMCLVFILQLSSYVWLIEIAGEEMLSFSELKLAVQELGVKPGVRRASLAPRQIEKALLLKFPNLVWAQLELRGVKALLTVAERSEAKGAAKPAGHIFAERDGVITQVLVLRGTAQVREGDTVQAGDLLISGVYYDGRGQKQFGSAEGIVRARVWYQAVGEAPLVVWQPVKTGERRLQFLVTIGPWTIPFGKSYSPETHLADRKDWWLSLGRAMVPLGFSRVDYWAVEHQPVPVPLETAKVQARALAWDSLLQQGLDPDEVRSENGIVEPMGDQDGIRVTLKVEAEQEIGLFLNQ